MIFSMEKKLNADILATTAKIQARFPEQYQILSETPLFLFSNADGVHNIDFEHYLDSLNVQLKAFEQAASAPKKL
jgi:hypothetical protein